MKDYMNIANVITLSRIVFAGLILFSDPFSVRFMVWYLLGAFTDMIDGTIARNMNVTSSFGSKLDSVADFLFIMAVLVKLCYALSVPGWIWIWMLIIAGIKVINLLSGFYRFHRLVSMHTMMNKMTGVLLFLLPLPYLLGLREVADIMGIGTGVVATLAAIQEGHYIRTGREVE